MPKQMGIILRRLSSMLVGEDPSKLQVIFDRLNDSTGMFGMGIVFSKCKISLHN